MFCTKCGNETLEGDAFCQRCGAPIRYSGSHSSGPEVRSTMGLSRPVSISAPPGAAPVSRVAALAAARPVGPGGSMPKKRPRKEYEARVQEAISERGKSAVFLVSIILFTVAIFLKLLDLDQNPFEAIAEIFYENNISIEGMRDLLLMDEDTVLMVNFITLLPNILLVIGFWLLFGGSFSTTGHGTTNGGLTLLTIAEVFNIVYLSISFLIGFISITSACSELSEYSRYYSYNSKAVSEAQSTLGFTLMILLGIMIFALIIRGKSLTTISTIRRAVNFSSPDSGVSGFVAVMTIIGGSFGVLSIVSEFDLSALLLGVSQVMLGVQLFFYKTAMSDLERESSLYDSGFSSFTGARSYGEGSDTTGIPAWKRVEMENEASRRDMY